MSAITNFGRSDIWRSALRPLRLSAPHLGDQFGDSFCPCLVSWRACGSVSQHGPNLPRSRPRGFEHKMAPVGSPTGALVAARVARQFHELAGDNFHHIEIIVSVRAPPAESQQLAVGRPRRINDVAHVGQIDFGLARSVRIHRVELRDAAAVADEGDLLAGLRIPGRGSIRAVRIGEALRALP